MPTHLHTHNRAIDSTIEQLCRTRGYSACTARVIAGRLSGDPETALANLSPAVDSIPASARLAGIEPAIARLSAALDNAEPISISVDHDADGVTSATVIADTLRVLGHPEQRLFVHASHRLSEGYGLSDALVDRILSAPESVGLVLTADHGSADAPRIARLAKHGVDTIVTDHHLIPEDGVPVAAISTINPQRDGCDYPDKSIAGCMVAWLVMRELAARRGLLRSLDPLLAVVAVGTIADCVNLASPVNRAVVRYGLDVIADSRRPCWRAVRSMVGQGGVDSQFLAYQLCPRLASPGRTDAADPGIAFLRARDAESADRWLAYLTECNDQRKSIQRAMRERVLEDVESRQLHEAHLICHFAPEGHPGIHGLVASKLVERYGRPAVVCSPHARHPDLVTGSCRSVAGVHLRDLLQSVSDAHPGLFVAFGGHAAAAGLTVRRSDLDTLFDALCVEAKNSVPERFLGRAVSIDGTIEGEQISLTSYDELAGLDPWGMGFPRPVFVAELKVARLRMVGRESRVHAALQLTDGHAVIKAIWFFAIDEPGQPMGLAEGQIARLLVELSEDTYRGDRKVQLIVRGLAAP